MIVPLPAPVPLSLASEADTSGLGLAIASRLRPGMLVLLDGDLGTGKTALARTIVRALAGNESMDVPSPSFALVQPYERADGTPVLHADLYRLASAAESDELGLFDEADAIVLVEWPERDPDLAARADLIVRLAQGAEETARAVQLFSPSGALDLADLVRSL